MATLKLQSNEGQVFEVDVEAAKHSEVLNTMLTTFEELGLHDDENEPIPLPRVNTYILTKIIEWVVHHKDDPPFTDNGNLPQRGIPAWDVEFLNVDKETLYGIIEAANYLDIRGLLDVACRTFANMIRSKSSEEIRKMFNIENDLQPDDDSHDSSGHFDK